jgi:hypothetical protein
MTDTYRGAGPLGKRITRTSTLLAHECASVTFDANDRIVAICVGLDAPILEMLNPKTLESLASMPLPPRQGASGGVFTDFSGGGYFYLDDQDRAIVPTYGRHVYVIGQTDQPGFELAARLRPDQRGAARRQGHLRAAGLGWQDRVRVGEACRRLCRPVRWLGEVG